MAEYQGCGLTIQRYVWDVVDSNSWLIRDKTSALLIDAVDSAELYQALADVEDLTVILTHSHFDHICGLNAIRAMKPGTIVYSTTKCSENIGNPYRNLSAGANAFLTFYRQGEYQHKTIEPFVCKPAECVFDEETAAVWNGHRITMSAFHGHSNDSLIAVIDGCRMFSGDTLLPIPTVTRFPGGSTRRFWEEDIPRLRKMNVENVYPGHGDPVSFRNALSVNEVRRNVTKSASDQLL